MATCRKCKATLPEGAIFCHICGIRQDAEKPQRKTRTRGNGTGTAFKRSNGTWVAQKTLEWRVDENGKMHRTYASKGGFKTKKEALNYLPHLSAQTKQEKKRLTTFRELYEIWEPIHEKNITKSTMDCYRAAMKHFRPLWNEPFTEITVDDLQECMDETPGKRTQQNMKAVCGLLYKYAIPRNMATLNMGQYLVVGGEDGLGKEGLPLEALEKLKQNVGKVPYVDYIVAQCYLGFRPSELLELDAANYDRKKKYFTGGAKTEAGRNRIVTVSPKIQSTIDRLTDRKVSGPVFCDTDGTPMAIEKYRQKFYAALEACGIDNPIIEFNGTNRRKYTPHSCRHTFSTLMKSVQAPDKDKLALIGHISTEMLRHYQDVDLEGLRKITDAI